MKDVKIDGAVVAKIESRRDLEKKLGFLQGELKKQETKKDSIHKAGMKVDLPERTEIFKEAVPYCQLVLELRKEILKLEKKLGV